MPKKIARACGFSVAPGEYRFWLLQPDLTNAPDLSPFFFATSYLYRDNLATLKDESLDANIDEWYRYTDKSVPKADIDSLLYSTPPSTFRDDFNHLKQTNLFVRYLADPSRKELLSYMQLAKQAEVITSNDDKWQDGEYSNTRINKVIARADSLYKLTGSSFIRLRLAFQMARLYSLNRRYPEVRKVYDERMEPVKTSSWLKTAGLYQCALAAPSREREYLFSQVFDKGNYMRSWCLIHFNSKKLDEIIRLAKNDHERTVMQAMYVFNYPGKSLNKIKSIYGKEPVYKEIPFLLLREINKVEDWLVTSKVTDFEPATHYDRWSEEVYNSAKNFREDTAYAGSLYAFINQVIHEQKNNSGLLQLYAAHLALVRENYALSQQHLQEAKKYAVASNVKTQIRVNELLLYILTHPTFDETAQAELLSILKTPNGRLAIHDPDIMKDQLILFIAKRIMAKGEIGKGLLLLSRTHRVFGELPIGAYKRVYQEMQESASPADYDYIISVLDKKQKTPYEKFVTQEFMASPGEDYYGYDYRDSIRWSRNKVLDCKASWYIQHDKLEAASATLNQIPDKFWKQEPYLSHFESNPFFLNVYHAYEAMPGEGEYYNKRQTIEKMIQLKKMAQRDPKQAAQCYFELGNAWYNLSWYGKSWLMVRQWWSMFEVDEYNKDLKGSAFNDIYYGCIRARNYYLLALKTTKDKKLAALCCMMAGQCETNYRRYHWYSSQKKDFVAPANPYINILRQKGFDGSFYEAVITECETYKSFIKQYNRWSK